MSPIDTAPIDMAPIEHGLPPTLRAAALGGVLGPVVFIGGWITAAATTTREYSSVDDAISRLAEIGADSRPLMTGALVALGAGLSTYAVALRRAVPGECWVAAAVTGAATLLVAAAPLARSSTTDTLHAAFAGIGYVTLAVTPMLAGLPLQRLGHRILAGAGIGAGVVSILSLALSAGPLPTGLFQRLGLTTTHAWIAASALSIAVPRAR